MTEPRHNFGCVDDSGDGGRDDNDDGNGRGRGNWRMVVISATGMFAVIFSIGGGATVVEDHDVVVDDA